MKTLTGIDFSEIQAKLNEPLPAAAYQEIPYGPMKGKTDISGERVRDRFDQVFGPMGLGWWIEAIPGLSTTQVSIDLRPVKDKGKVVIDSNGEIVTQTWYVADLLNYQFCYRVTVGDDIVICRGSSLSDSSDNMDRSYALRGAMTALTKQAYARLGGLNHVYYGEYDHQQASKDKKVSPALNNRKLSDSDTRTAFFAACKEKGKSSTAVMAILNARKVKLDDITFDQGMKLVFPDPVETEDRKSVV